MVTSPAEACSREHEDEDDYLIPEELDQLKEQTAQYTEAIEHDGRYGLLAVLVYEVLLEWGYFAKEDCEQAELRKSS